MERRIREALGRLEAEGRIRTILSNAGPQGRLVDVGGQRLLNFSSNDTLGFAAHPEIIAAAHRALDRFGHGAGAARLLTGSFSIADELEEAVSAWLGSEAALLFSSGYHANLAVMATLGGLAGRIFSDQDNHASLIDGIRLAGTEKHIYPHWDPPLSSIGADDLVVTESIFSMEGVPMEAGWEAKVAATGAALVVDEAHALGWAGERGRGLASPGSLCVIGTFGKALGSFGAFVAGRRPCIELLRSAARPFIFTTGLPAATLGGSIRAIELVQGSVGDDARETLSRSCAAVRAKLGGLVSGEGPIFTLPIGGEASALAASQALETQGLLVRAVRPPTVPAGTSRLRIVLSAAHTARDIDCLCDALDGVTHRVIGRR